MHVQALDARTINALANIKPERYAALVSVPRDSVVTAWREMAACHAAACAALERELGERHGLGVSDFEVLERLVESKERKFRAQDLADAVHLSQSALSRLVDRLARHGLVERCGCEGDRRGIYVVLTEAGEQRHAEATPTHRGVLARTLPSAMLAAANNQPS
jgi:DNA-binding MarR family transcriptional regulator